MAKFEMDLYRRIFLSRTKKIDRGYDTPCWEWQGSRVKGDREYGIFKSERAYRISAMLFKGFDIKSKLFVMIMKGRSKFSEERKRKIGASAKERYKHINPPFYGRTHSDESKDKMSKGNMGKTLWNKGLTKENDPRVALYSSKKIGIKRPQEVKDKISETLLRRVL